MSRNGANMIRLHPSDMTFELEWVCLCVFVFIFVFAKINVFVSAYEEKSVFVRVCACLCMCASVSSFVRSCTCMNARVIHNFNYTYSQGEGGLYIVFWIATPHSHI